MIGVFAGIQADTDQQALNYFDEVSSGTGPLRSKTRIVRSAESYMPEKG
jgi:hypothetical protein